ncbi:MAG: PAS domain S-box protein [Pseudomonadota bacterium]
MPTDPSLPTSATATSCKNLRWRRILPTFFLLSFFLTLFLALLIYIHTRETTSHNLELLMHQQQSHIRLAETLLQHELERMSIDLLAITNTPVLQHFFKTPEEQLSRQRVNEGLSNFIELRTHYTQARILDTRSRELIRVEKRDQQVAVIPTPELEADSEDPFVHKTLLLEGQGQVVFSPMELERGQKGTIEQPLQATFRIGTPIFDQQQRQCGIIIFTCEGRSLIDLFLKATKSYHDFGKDLYDNSQIVNEEGYWLLAPEKKDKWENTPQRRFDLRFPELWVSMRQQGQGHLQTQNGLFTFTTMPLMVVKKQSSNDSSAPAGLKKQAEADSAPFLLLLTQISAEDLHHLDRQTWLFHLLLFVVICICCQPLLLWMALLKNKEQLYKEHLQVQEERFRLLYDKAPLPYQSLDQEGHLLNINDVWLKVTGYSRDEVLGRRFDDFVSPPSLTYFHESFQGLMGKDETRICEIELIKKDGSLLLAEFHAQWGPKAQGDIFQTHCIFNDITELRAEKQRTNHLGILLRTIIKIHELIDQEKEKESLIGKCCEILTTSRGYSSAWIIILPHDQEPGIAVQSGLSHDLTLLQQQIEQANPPPCIQSCRKLTAVISTDDPATFCQTCPMAGEYPRNGIMCTSVEHGSHHFGYLNVSLPIDFVEDQEEKDRFREISKDIGYALFNLEQQRKKIEMEKALQQSEERLRGITDSASDAILMMDPHGAISYWNPAAERILGYGAEEVLGRDLHTLLAPVRYHAAHQAAFPEFLRSGQGNAIGKTVELSALRKDGREIPVHLSLSAVFQDGEWHAVGILRDMTERKLMEEQMLQSEKMSTIAGLAAGVAHEINTPLSAILQSIQVIQQSLSPDLARNQEIAAHCELDLTRVQNYFEKRDINFFMDGIKESAIKSGRIISNLLQFSRPRKLEVAPTDLTLLLDKSVELAKNDYNLRKQYDILNLEVIRDYTPNLPQVSCIATEIQQVFINLLQNAVQAMGDRQEPGPKAQLILRVLRHGAMIRIEIADNGPGINEETRLHIFDPFFTTKDIGAGTGLGLSVSYTIIVTKHKGQLTVQSVPGQGATFVIDLPLDKGTL